jgi:hypothetical protein
MSVRTLIIASVIALLPSLGDAQNQAQTRDGFWFNGGAGFGSLGCRDCDGRRSAVTLALGAGGTLSQKVLLGASIDAWTKSEGTVAALLARLRFYPSITRGLFLTGGLGLGRRQADATDFTRSDTGTAELIGLGYDLRLSPNLSLTPFWNWFATQTTNDDHNVAQLGLSLTVH